MKLILIEDEKKEQDKFKKLAEKMNDVTFVKITNSTEEGIKCLKENDIDGVILDLELNSGTGNGFEFLEKLKITKLSKIPKIVVTTNVYSDSVYDYLHQNKVDFIFYKKQENYNVENVINTLLLLNNYSIYRYKRNRRRKGKTRKTNSGKGKLRIRFNRYSITLAGQKIFI